MLQTITHPTDFSAEGQVAFVHALRLAQAVGGRLDLLHVHSPDDDDRWGRFPHVREVLERWGVLPPGTSVEDIEAIAGIRVHKVEIRDDGAAAGLSHFLAEHRPDLLVMASHGHHWLSGSVSTRVMHEAHVPTLVFGPAAEPFVDAGSGALALGTILVPVAHDPAPDSMMRRLAALVDGFAVEFDVVHVGEPAPVVHDAAGAPLAVRRLEGPVVEGIVAAAADAQLIAMPTAGHQSILDMLRGSTTEQVIRRASRPVLALPAGA